MWNLFYKCEIVTWNLYIHSITVDMMKIEDLYMYLLLTYYLYYSIWTKKHIHSHKKFYTMAQKAERGHINFF